MSNETNGMSFEQFNDRVVSLQTTLADIENRVNEIERSLAEVDSTSSENDT
jgi:uncharacterized protein YukE